MSSTFLLDTQVQSTYKWLMRNKATRKQRSKWGRKGGLIGGPARAKALSEARRSEIARAGAKRRWFNYRLKRFQEVVGIE